MLEDIKSKILEARPVRLCAIGGWASGLSAEDQAILAALLADDELNGEELWASLVPEGMPGAPDTFRTHRRGDCCCYR